jgi:superfamily II DNA or RNA helicase
LKALGDLADKYFLNEFAASPEARRESEEYIMLVERITKAGERSILFFTNSVQHAEEMAARLNITGIPTATVSGSTPAVARRYFLDRL